MDDDVKKRLNDVRQAIESGDKPAYKSLIEVFLKTLPDVDDLLAVAELLLSKAEFEDADCIIRDVIEVNPRCWAAHEAYVTSAQSRRNWVEAAARSESAELLLPHDPRPVLKRAVTLMIMEDFSAAENLLTLAAARFPDSEDIAHELARIPLVRGDLEAAVARLSSVSERFPESIRALASTAETLRLLGKFNEAEELLEPARGRFEKHVHFGFQSAWNAVRLRRWQQAFERWNLLIGLYPDADGVDMALGETIALWHLAKVEGDPNAISAQVPPEIGRRAGITPTDSSEPDSGAQVDREVMMKFEGLGDNCEFGLVQRQFGAEPIGLLRWSSGIRPKQLVEALACRFAGVGDRENTFLHLHSVSKEYFSGDKRFFQMHTFIKQNEHDESVLLSKMCRRMSYLAQKLVADLDEGAKIFVYKPDGADLSVTDGAEIARQIKINFPAAKLMLMRLASSQSEIGEVAPFRDNVIWGFLSSFAVNLNRKFIKFEEWRRVCDKAISHFENSVGVPPPAQMKLEVTSL